MAITSETPAALADMTATAASLIPSSQAGGRQGRKYLAWQAVSRAGTQRIPSCLHLMGQDCAVAPAAEFAGLVAARHRPPVRTGFC